MSKLAAEGVEVHEILHNTLEKISEVINSREQDIVVDVELHFKSICMDKTTGLKLLFSQKFKEESLDIRISTRIRSS